MFKELVMKQVKFKTTCKEPIAKAVGDEVGNLIGGNEDSYCVEFPVYGASFSMSADCFDVIEDTE